MIRFVVLGCAVFGAFPVPAATAAGGAISLFVSGVGLPSATYSLLNYTQNEKTFTATTPFDQSAANLTRLAGTHTEIETASVTLDGTVTRYTNCLLTSDTITASTSAANVKLRFTCQKFEIATIPPSPTPSPVLRSIDPMKPMLVPSPVPTIKK